MPPFASVAVGVWLACCASPATADGPAPSDRVALRTFVVPKPLAAIRDDADEPARAASADAVAPPRARGNVRSTVGLGYVQRAGWGAEVLATGSVAGLDLQLESLATFGREGARFDHGTLLLRSVERGWLAEAGDLFSDLRGPVRGGRVSWQASDRWQPSLSIYVPRLRTIDRRPVVAYTDRVHLGPLWIGGEVASDRSHFLRTRFAAGRMDLEASYRRARTPAPLRDAGAQGRLRIWREFSLSAGMFTSERPGDRSEWRTVAVHIPVHRSFGLTLERTFSKTSFSTDISSAAMVNVHAGPLMFFYRYRQARADYVEPTTLGSLSREQFQSIASYAPGPRVNFALQMATQWTATDRAQQWLELQTTVRVTRRTALHVAMPVAKSLDAERLRVQIEQGLPARLSLVAEYGRPSGYQPVQDGLEPARFMLMLRSAWDIATPTRGGQIRGQVRDYVGRPVAGARVRLGPYSADTDAAGGYSFAHVPRGEFDLALDAALLPADYAWDGRARHLAVDARSRFTIDLVVAPLNAIHGRVYADRNGNGRWDADEGVADAVVRLNDRATATDAHGGYDFYNLRPGAYIVRLESDRLPAGLEASGSTTLTVELREDRPVVGADFVVVTKTKPVIWREIK